ncbi:MAG: RIP metalloprotease RseP [Anaerovibrio sp.]|uniref:RIP metalloprotease RseP n=1 Tax=Anaerovibrio sp. TaxID=1872532 RepID=UPI00261B004E|nr:RIP metalloprotease RseP [Anaerovibrio sp.]MDD7677553.1 RIP metalloprotease RseP [Anaerovibrio sp.]MDY2602924.1 RIP metalloprotease RseP [Anaerovibrio sp.]
MTTIVAAIFVFGLLVLVHELGHFMVAKLTGMRVDEFAIGFGPKLWSRKYGETLYAIRAVPLGGFNRIAGMDYEIIERMGNEAEEKADDGGRESGWRRYIPSVNRENVVMVPDDEGAGERAYFRRPIWARMLMVLAGSFMNFILPLFIFFGIFYFSGVATPSPEPVIGAVMAEKPAAMAGLMKGDRILTIDGSEVTKWDDISRSIQGAEGKPFKLTYQRDGEVRSTTLIPEEEPDSKRVIIGITSSADIHQPGILEAAGLAAQKVFFVLMAMVGALIQLMLGSVGAEALSGPVGIVQMTGEVANQGILPLLNFTAFLSLNLGLINLLPVPALDGGHFVMLVLEGLRGKPLGPKAMYYIQAAGVTLLVSLMIFTTFNDLMK